MWEECLACSFLCNDSTSWPRNKELILELSSIEIFAVSRLKRRSDLTRKAKLKRADSKVSF